MSMMDTQTVDLLIQNVTAWCTRHAALLEAMEKSSGTAEATKAYGDLEALGVLDILHDPSMRDNIGMVASLAHAFALHSPSLALLVVQQNMAAYLLAEAGLPAPTGWVTLPLYDAPAEWPHQVRHVTKGRKVTLDGVWGSLAGLPIAQFALLPVERGDAASFALARVAIGAASSSIEHRGGVISLGLRGCPAGDLVFRDARLTDEMIVAGGADIRAAMVTLWSHAEVCMLAIRAAVLERSYTVARDYAAVRWQGGRVIIEHSLIRRMLADLHLAKSGMDEAWRSMAARLEPGKPLTAGQMSTVLDSAAELPKLTSDGIQLLGGNGYMEDYGQERLFRDAKQCEMLLGHPQAKRFSIWENA